MALYRSLGARPDETRGTTALEVRKDLARLFTGPGVLPGADSPLVVGSDTFAYVVRSAGWVTSRGEGDGVHLWGNDGDHTISEADDGTSLVAPAPGLSRIDVIYALHPSASENGDTTSAPIVTVRKGVEASVPVAPSLPVGGLELARNTMTSAATSTSSGGNTISQTAALATLARQSLSATVVGNGATWQSNGTAYREGGLTSLTGAITRSVSSITIGREYTTIGLVPQEYQPVETHSVSVLSGQGVELQGAILTSSRAIQVRSRSGTTVLSSGDTIPLAQFGPFRHVA